MKQTTAKLTGCTPYQNGSLDGWLGARFRPTTNAAYAFQYAQGYRDGEAKRRDLAWRLNAAQALTVQP